MQLTPRDYIILDFIETCPTNSSIISSYLNCSLQVVQRRLQKLFQNNYICRWRTDINSNYIYYSRRKTKPRDLGHMLYLSKFFVYLKQKGYDIKLFKREVTLAKGIRSDALIVLNRGNGLEALIVEVEIYTQPQEKIIKYSKYKNDKGYIELFPNMPTLLFLTNKKVNARDLVVECITLGELDGIAE